MTYDFGTKSKQLSVARGRLDSGSFTIDLTRILESESRLGEIKFLQNKNLSAELMTDFNSAANHCGKHLASVEYEILSAENTLEQIKSDILIDELPKELEKMGMSKSSADIRQAIIVRNSRYQEGTERLNHLKSVKKLLSEKLKSFERAYYTCKSVAYDRSRLPGIAPATNVGSTYNSEESNDEEPMVVTTEPANWRK